jgi:hypothetical protein
MRRQKVLDWMVASFTRIQCPLNFLLNQVCTLLLYKGYRGLISSEVKLAGAWSLSLKLHSVPTLRIVELYLRSYPTRLNVMVVINYTQGQLQLLLATVSIIYSFCEQTGIDIITNVKFKHWWWSNYLQYRHIRHPVLGRFFYLKAEISSQRCDVAPP